LEDSDEEYKEITVADLVMQLGSMLWAPLQRRKKRRQFVESKVYMSQFGTNLGCGGSCLSTFWIPSVDLIHIFFKGWILWSGWFGYCC
jgi:hypothetical protein